MKKIVIVRKYECENCENTVKENDQYCSRCGKDLNEVEIYEENTLLTRSIDKTEKMVEEIEETR